MGLSRASTGRAATIATGDLISQLNFFGCHDFGMGSGLGLLQSLFPSGQSCLVLFKSRYEVSSQWGRSLAAAARAGRSILHSRQIVPDFEQHSRAGSRAARERYWSRRSALFQMSRVELTRWPPATGSPNIFMRDFIEVGGLISYGAELSTPPSTWRLHRLAF